MYKRVALAVIKSERQNKACHHCVMVVGDDCARNRLRVARQAPGNMPRLGATTPGETASQPLGVVTYPRLPSTLFHPCKLTQCMKSGHFGLYFAARSRAHLHAKLAWSTGAFASWRLIEKVRPRYGRVPVLYMLLGNLKGMAKYAFSHCPPRQNHLAERSQAPILVMVRCYASHT